MIDYKPSAIICDLDGTLAILNGRNPYDASSCFKDDLNDTVYLILSTYNNFLDTQIIFITGREENYRPQTIAWLEFHHIPYSQLHMRPDDSKIPGYEFKLDVLNTLVGNYNILFALEDDPRCAKMYRENLIPCLQVNDWEPYNP